MLSNFHVYKSINIPHANHIQQMQTTQCIFTCIHVSVLSYFASFFPSISHLSYLFPYSCEFLHCNYDGITLRCNKTNAIRHGKKPNPPDTRANLRSFTPFNDLHVLRLIFKIHYVKPTKKERMRQSKKRWNGTVWIKLYGEEHNGRQISNKSAHRVTHLEREIAISFVHLAIQSCSIRITYNLFLSLSLCLPRSLYLSARWHVYFFVLGFNFVTSLSRLFVSRWTTIWNMPFGG